MKKLIIASIFAVYALSSCKSTRYITDHDYSYDTNFLKFHTFDFVKCDNDSSGICAEIQATIQKQMEIRGYQYAPNQADVYIGYSLLPNKVSYKAFKQPTIGRWMKKYDTDETYKAEKYNFYNGMVMLSMIEAKSNILVWRGFASDISVNQKKEFNMDYYYSSAVRNIFKEYSLFAVNNR